MRFAIVVSICVFALIIVLPSIFGWPNRIIYHSHGETLSSPYYGDDDSAFYKNDYAKFAPYPGARAIGTIETNFESALHPRNNSTESYGATYAVLAEPEQIHAYYASILSQMGWQFVDESVSPSFLFWKSSHRWNYHRMNLNASLTVYGADSGQDERSYSFALICNIPDSGCYRP